MAEATNFKFGMQNDYKEFYQKNAKLGNKGAWPRSRDLFLNFGTPFPVNISVTTKARNFKFGTQKGYRDTTKNAKSRDKGGVA